jgi:hypothetical protein
MLGQRPHAVTGTRPAIAASCHSTDLTDLRATSDVHRRPTVIQIKSPWEHGRMSASMGREA